MTAAERRKREFAQREQCLVDAALELAADVGFMGMSMADLARQAEYATGTLYKHFDCKEDLLMAMTAVGNRERAKMMQRVAAWDASSRQKMMAIGYSWLTIRCISGWSSWRRRKMSGHAPAKPGARPCCKPARPVATPLRPSWMKP